MSFSDHTPLHRLQLQRNFSFSLTYKPHIELLGQEMLSLEEIQGIPMLVLNEYHKIQQYFLNSL